MLNGFGWVRGGSWLAALGSCCLLVMGFQLEAGQVGRKKRGEGGAWGLGNFGLVTIGRVFLRMGPCKLYLSLELPTVIRISLLM
jgi:hypothetical protein